MLQKIKSTLLIIVSVSTLMFIPITELQSQEFVFKINNQKQDRFIIKNGFFNFNLSCDENAIDNLDGTCTVTLQTSTILNCPSGYSFSNGQCSQQNISNAIFGCRLKVEIGGVCYSNWGKILQPDGSTVCPSHTTPYGSKCVDYNGPTTSKIYYCSNSSATLSGTTCYLTTYTSGTVACPSDYTLNDNICEQIVTVSASKNCPTGTSLNDEETACI